MTHKKKLTKNKQSLQEEYNIENNILESNNKQKEQSKEQCKQAESWRLINIITGRITQKEVN